LNHRQKIALVAPPILMGMMYPIFHLLSGLFEERIGWYVGLLLYWLIWGEAFSRLMIGRESIRSIIRPQKPNVKVLLMVLFPLLMAALYRFIPGMEYEKPSRWILLLLLSSCFGNGFFEELLWRGLYLCLFPDSILFKMVWPSIWFALWHYVPGSVSSGGNVLGLMIGSGLMGFYLSFLAHKTGTIWWAIVAHTLGGIIMVV
jgi:membrane protease YdiL (CAAX protease family)